MMKNTYLIRIGSDSSNSDANPNPLNLGPYTVPPIDTARSLLVAPSATKAL